MSNTSTPLRRVLGGLCAAMLCGPSLLAQDFTVPMPIPPLAKGTEFVVTPHMGTHSFAHDTLMNVMTMGYNVTSDSGSYSMDYLGPTLNWVEGDSILITVNNMLMDTTTIHWHGMHIPAMMDGGPHQMVAPMVPWTPSFRIRDEASTMWYHPHLHHMTYMQVQMGLAGLIRITSPADTVLPHHYGIDDIPLVVQDKPFNYDSATGMDTINTALSIHGDSVSTPGFFGNTYLVNGIWNPQDTVPAQMVRYRILNGAQGRSFNIGFSAGADTAATMNFYVVASDAGRLDSAYIRSRILVNPGERWEIVVDYSSLSPGDSVTMWTYMRELNPADGIDGGPPTVGFNQLTGRDYAIARIHISPPTTDTPPMFSIPTSFGPITPYPGTVTNSRVKHFYGDFPHAPSIDSIPFDMEVINDIVYLNSMEEWTLVNRTNEAHPFHIHDVHFFVTHSNNPLFDNAIYKGPKDVVIVPAYDTVKFITQFLDFADSIHPYMYHCHILAHEDQGMMHQWLVWDSAWGIVGVNPTLSQDSWTIYPNPTDGRLWMKASSDAPSTLLLMDLQGKVLQRSELQPFQGEVPVELPLLSKGMYLLVWESPGGTGVKQLVKH